MNVLEKILEEVERIRDMMNSPIDAYCFGGECKYSDCTVCVCEKIIEIIRSHTDDYSDGWIPCSESLPTKSGYYLACIHDAELGDYDIRRIWFAHADDYDMVKHDWRELEEYENVTAWQLLPEPYKPEEPKATKNIQQEFEDFWRDK